MTAPMLSDVLLQIITDVGAAGATESYMREEFGDFKAPHPERIRSVLLQLEREGKIHRHEQRWRRGPGKGKGVPAAKPEAPKLVLPSREERGLARPTQSRPDDGEVQRTCSACALTKPIDEFRIVRGGGRALKCRACNGVALAAAQAARYARERGQEATEHHGRPLPPVRIEATADDLGSILDQVAATAVAGVNPPPAPPRASASATHDIPPLSQLPAEVLLNALCERMADHIYALILQRHPHLSESPTEGAKP